MENEYKCRTCLATGTQKEIGTNLLQAIYNSSETTYKDVLLQLVPQMEANLSEGDSICFSCRKFLKTVVRFIEQCLEVEEQLTDGMEGLLSEDVVMQEDGDEPGIGNIDGAAEILENIEIIVQNDGEASEYNPAAYHSSAQSEGSSNSGSPRNEDHAYIKSEIEDGEICMDEESGQFKLYVGDGTEEIEGENEGEIVPHEEIDSVFIKTEMPDDDSMDASDEKQQKGTTFMCEVCGKNFQHSIMLQRHLATHMEKRVECPDCDKIFKSEMYLKRHRNLVHEAESGVRYMCSECNKLFKNKGALNAHFKLKHLRLQPYKCEICDETFGRADYLKKHLSQHVKSPSEENKKTRSRIPGKFIRFKNTDDPIPCKICGKYYNGIHKLKVHLQTHVVVKRYACEYCDLTYKRWPSLKRHEKTHLESEGTFHRCNVCWKRLPTKEDLNIHMTQHGNPRYRCHICDEQFHRKYLFDNHFLLQHATPEDLEISKKEVIYDTLLELANQSS